MPLTPNHISRFLKNVNNEKDASELLNLLIKRVNDLCFNECQVDRVSCTLTPMCSRRFLLKLRVKNGLKADDLPKFCYSVLKGVVERDFRGKTVVYKPSDSFLYLVDFLDIFFHGDYRKLNKFISFKNWEDAIKIFDDRIYKRKENFLYKISDNFNYIVFLFGERLHVIHINKGYVICNANRENIDDLELLKTIIEVYKNIYFPEVKMVKKQNSIEMTIQITHDIISKIKLDKQIEGESIELFSDVEMIPHRLGPTLNPNLDYFWKSFSGDIEALIQYCREIGLRFDKNNNLKIKLLISTTINNSLDKAIQTPLRYRDLRPILNFINRIYNEFYVIWVK